MAFIIITISPKLKVNCRTLKDKLDVSATPILKQIGEKYIEREFQNILVYPKKEHIDFTPAEPAGKLHCTCTCIVLYNVQYTVTMHYGTVQYTVTMHYAIYITGMFRGQYFYK